MLLTNNSSTFIIKPQLDIPLYILSKDKPELRLVGKGSRLRIEKNIVAIEGQFNIEVIPPYKAYCLFTPKLNNQDIRPTVLILNITGPSFPPDSVFIPFLQGDVLNIYRVNKWATFKDKTPFQIGRQIKEVYSFESLLEKSDLEEIPLN